MNHLICRVERFEIIAPYALRIDFDDATQQIVDFLPVLQGELYGPLRDLALFNQVALDSEVHTLVWPNGADFDPATLHEWPRCGGAFAVGGHGTEDAGERGTGGRGTDEIIPNVRARK